MKIEAEGTEFELIDSEAISERGTFGLELPFSADELAKSSDMRIALFRGHLPPNEPIPYVLVWQDKTDLGDLEARLQNGDYKDQDFSNALRTSYRKLRCPACDAEVRAFVIDSGDPYPFNETLHRDKIEKMEVKKCPHCSSRLRQLVAKIV